MNHLGGVIAVLALSRTFAREVRLPSDPRGDIGDAAAISAPKIAIAQLERRCRHGA